MNDNNNYILEMKSTPTPTHAKIIIESAKDGKNIFCEKPIDFDIKRIKDVIETVKEYKVKLQIGFNRRLDHNFKRAHEIINEGKIGDRHIIKITSRDPKLQSLEYIKDSGGIFLDMTIHDFDMVRFLTGSELERDVGRPYCRRLLPRRSETADGFTTCDGRYRE